MSRMDRQHVKMAGFIAHELAAFHYKVPRNDTEVCTMRAMSFCPGDQRAAEATALEEISPHLRWADFLIPPTDGGLKSAMAVPA